MESDGENNPEDGDKGSSVFDVVKGFAIEGAKGVLGPLLGIEFDEKNRIPTPEASTVDLNDMPYRWRLGLFLLFELGLLATAAVLFATQLNVSLTATFISLDPGAGQCSEVPQVITGTFLADLHGYWESDQKFSYTLSSYSVNLLALQYTTETWTQKFHNISEQVRAVGMKSAQRDYAWNMVACTFPLFICYIPPCR